jgi:hypothetical protein
LETAAIGTSCMESMSEAGQSLPDEGSGAMSAPVPIATDRCAARSDAKGQERPKCVAAKMALFDHLVGAQQNSRR